MNFFDNPFKKGSNFLLTLGIAGTLFFAVYGFFEPEDRYFSLFFVLIGLFFTWRQYLAWKEHRDKH